MAVKNALHAPENSSHYQDQEKLLDTLSTLRICNFVHFTSLNMDFNMIKDLPYRIDGNLLAEIYIVLINKFILMCL